MLKLRSETQGQDGEPWRPAFLSQADKIAKVVAEAQKLGEKDVRAIVRAVETEGPVGRFILKLLDLPTPPSRRGRPLGELSESADLVVAQVVAGLRQSGKGAAEAYREAPAILAERAIYEPGTRSKSMSEASVKAACRRRDDRTKHWFEPPASE